MTRPVELWAKEDRHAAGEQNHWRPATKADIVANLAAMPAEKRAELLRASGVAASFGLLIEKAERERDEARDAARGENKVLVAMCDETKKRVIVLEKERDELRDQRNEAMAKYGFMVERACDEKLDGYRELASRLAAAKNDLDEALKRAEKAERVAEERENIIKAQATEIDRARDRWDEAIKRTDVAETRLSRLRERGVQITGRVCSPISDDAIYYAEMLGLVVEDRDVLRTKLAAVEKERDSYRDALNAMTRGATQGAELIHRLEKERDDLRTKLREVELERDDRREVFALVRDQRDARTALSYKLEAALGQAEKELHECRVALKDALGGLDSVKDQNADLRRQLRRLQTGTEIESDRLTDVELNLQATVDRVRAERDEAINALRAAEAKMEPGRGAGGG
jgi:hypothetical protein